MSFSGSVKEELYKHMNGARHCILAEIAAVLAFCGSIGSWDNGIFLQIEAENALVVRKCFTLLQKTFNIGDSITVHKEGKSGSYAVRMENEALVQRILLETRFLESDSAFRGLREPVNEEMIRNTCCQRAYLRGVFLAVGSMSDPGKSNHLELVCGLEKQAQQILELLQNFGIEAHIVVRKKYHVVYIKEGSGISDFLNVTEAHMALMEFENCRIVKEMRNSINRRVNCETANITKTVSAAARQTEDILYLRDKYGFEKLPDSLREMAEVRLEYPDVPLRELGNYLNPPIGKSGVNHRLRKLCELADRIRS